MDAALQAMLAGQGDGGNQRLFGVFPDLEGIALEGVVNPQSLNLDELLKKLFPLMQQALVFNFPGGFLWQKFIKAIVEKLMQQLESMALTDGYSEGITGGGEVGHSGPVSPSSGGASQGGSISGHEM